MNQFNLIGRLTRDPDIVTDKNAKLAKIYLAVNYGDKAYFFPIESWGKPAEILECYARKGDQIGISGNLGINAWVTKEGAKRNDIVLRATQIDLLGRKHVQDKEIKEETETMEMVQETNSNIDIFYDQDGERTSGLPME